MLKRHNYSFHGPDPTFDSDLSPIFLHQFFAFFYTLKKT